MIFPGMTPDEKKNAQKVRSSEANTADVRRHNKDCPPTHNTSLSILSEYSNTLWPSVKASPRTFSLHAWPAISIGTNGPQVTDFQPNCPTKLFHRTVREEIVPSCTQTEGVSYMYRQCMFMHTHSYVHDVNTTHNRFLPANSEDL